MLVSTTYYRSITGDVTTPDAAVATAASAAQDLLEGELGRAGYLEEAERTETLDLFDDGTVYPTATPVTDAGDYVVHDDVVFGAVPDVASFVGLIDSIQPRTVALTYTGGYTAASCPECILRDIAWAAWAILRPELVAGLATAGGASSVRVGDVAVTWADSAGGVPAAGAVGIAWSPQTLRYRRRQA